MSDRSGTFLVTEVDAETAVLRDVESGQIHTLESHPDLEAGELLRGTLAPVQPMEVVWTVEALEERWTVPVIDSEMTPTRQAKRTAEAVPPGTVERLERKGAGEIHVITVPDGEVAAAIEDVLDDEAVPARAARLEAARVEVRTGDDFLSVRYLPD